MAPRATAPSRARPDLAGGRRARHLPLDPDPIRLARALEKSGLPHVALLDRPGCAWLTAAPDARSGDLDPLATAAPGPPLPLWIGVIPYEARRNLERPAWTAEEIRPPPAFQATCWLRYPTVLEITDEVRLVGDDDDHAAVLSEALRCEPGPLAHTSVAVEEDDPAAHLERIRRAIELIVAGDLYQVSLARCLSVQLTGEPLDLYARLREVAPGAQAAALATPQGWVLSTSPELLLRLENHEGGEQQLITEPIKGTRPRGSSPARDAAWIAELADDPKERAELAMIIDVERNDLGSVCERVTIERAPAVQTHPTVHHRSALLSGILRAGVSRSEALAAMVPSGSVTGAPKVRAMEVIAKLEAHRRGLYTGGFGYLASDGSAELGMAIRTLTLSGSEGRYTGSYFTGGGIVVSSNPEQELAETRWKAAQLAAVTAR